MRNVENFKQEHRLRIIILSSLSIAILQYELIAYILLNIAESSEKLYRYFILLTITVVIFFSVALNYIIKNHQLKEAEDPKDKLVEGIITLALINVPVLVALALFIVEFFNH